MVNNKIYTELVQNYKRIAQEFSKKTIETPVQEKLEKLVELEVLLLEHIEELSSDELTKLKHYHDLVNELYRHHLEITWRERFETV